MEEILIYNQDAEASLLGRLILNAELIGAIGVEEEDFFSLQHRKIFNKIKSDLESGLPCGVVSLKKFVGEVMEDKEAIQYFLEIASVDSFLNPSEKLKTLRDLRIKREIKDIILETVKNIENNDKNSQEIKESIVEKVEAVSLKSSFAKKALSLFDLVKETFSKSNEQKILYSEFESIDKIVGGFDHGSLVIVAGRPAMGKSSLVMNIALRVAAKSPVLFLSLEMSGEQISKRIIANFASINLKKLRHNSLTSQYEVEAFQRAVKRTEEINLHIEDGAGLTLASLRYKIKKFTNKHKNGKLVVIDYLQLIKHKSKGGSVERVTEITNELKILAMEFDIVIIALSQLSRAVESRDDKRPQLSDLRDSGSIEQDADVVIFTFRPEYYLSKEQPTDFKKAAEWESDMQRLKGVAYAIVAKARDSDCGEAKLHFDGQFQRFTDLIE